MMFSLTSLCNPDAFKRENLNASLHLCLDSKASYYQIIVYSFLSTVITFAGLAPHFHNWGFSNFFIHVRHVLSRSNCLWVGHRRGGGGWLSITAYYSVQVHRSSVVNVQKRMMGQAIFSHRCTHVVIQLSQCACASFTFARCHWNCTGNLEKNANIWKEGSITISDCHSRWSWP